MTIYADVVFIENLIMNYIILYATAIIARLNKKVIRMIASSSIGGIYAILIYMANIEFITGFALKIVLSVAMVYIAFKPKTIKGIIKALIQFYLVSFTFGGASFMLLYFVKPSDIRVVNGVYIGMYPVKIAFLGGIVGFGIIVTGIKNIKGKFSSKDMFCDVIICYKQSEAHVKALIDSGNLLKEPITGMPVIIVESSDLVNILPSQVLNNLSSIINGDAEGLDNINDICFRVIPFCTIGKNSGLLLGFKPDYIKIIEDVNEKIVQDVVVAIFQDKFSSNRKYTALIGIDIFGRECMLK